MPSEFGLRLKTQIFGESHGEAVGVVLDGLPAGHVIDLDMVRAFLARRKGGNSPYVTARAEGDEPRVLSGLYNGRTCGSPLCAVFENRDVRSRDYDSLRHTPRPSHADYNAHVKYGGYADPRGGGHFSGRLTLPLCFAGAVCSHILEERGVFTGAHVLCVADVYDDGYDPVRVTAADLRRGSGFPVINTQAGEAMKRAIEKAAGEGDSLGGVVECAVAGLPQGVGEPMFAGLENRISLAVFGIPAVRGIEFGAGFAAAGMRGNAHNDPYINENGTVKPASNNAGGVLGGISTGMPVVFRVAFKPTPSIAAPQDTVDVRTGDPVRLSVTGRHDPCVVPRAVPCVEAAAAIAILDLLLVGGL